jgi:hypothetical protein
VYISVNVYSKERFVYVSVHITEYESYSSKISIPVTTPADSSPTSVDSSPTPVESSPTPADSGPTPVESGPTPADSGGVR